MILILTLIAAFPMGYFMRSWFQANVAYGLAFAQVFTFQTATLVLQWVKGDDAAFAQTEGYALFTDSLSYGMVTTSIYALGFGLVALGHRASAGRRARASTANVELERAT